jgi:hypothetical protein
MRPFGPTLSGFPAILKIGAIFVPGAIGDFFGIWRLAFGILPGGAPKTGQTLLSDIAG